MKLYVCKELYYSEYSRRFILVVDGDQAPSDTLERLKNITKMFSGKDDGQQELQKVERISPSEKIKRTFRK